jgi:hypothetical protein
MRPDRLEWLYALLGLVVLGCLALLIVLRLGPPNIVPRDAAETEFSAERAHAHIEQIAREPRPTGSPAARQTEAYITSTLTALGLSVKLQTAPGCVEAAGLRRCAHVRNVIATLAGRESDGTILLSAHYDSVPNAPGAGDDASGVAVLLETARALTRAGTPAHDVMFAFLDGEEELLLGAAAFCNVRASLPRVQIVGNFDARGSRGPATLVGASPGSGALISELARVLPRPVLNSFYPTVASVLPNATDAEVYTLCGLPTLSFAFADGFEHYHQGSDTPEHLDDRSVQHQGAYAMAIARRFAFDGPIAAPERARDLVFFDVGGLFVVRYPYFLARAVALALTGLAVVVAVRRVRAHRVRLPTLLIGMAAFIGYVVAAALIGLVVLALVPIAWRPWLVYIHASMLALCASFFVAALLLRASAAIERPEAAELLALAPLGVWVCVACLAGVFAPGVSHLFVWPAAMLVAPYALGVDPQALGTLERFALRIPAVVLMTPVIYTLLVIMGGPGVVLAMVCLALLLGLCAEPLAVLADDRKLAATLLAAAGLAMGLVMGALIARQRGPAVGNTVAYAIDAATQRALWLSPDPQRDAYKQQFLGDHPEHRRVEAFRSSTLLWTSEAPRLAAEPPALRLISDTWTTEGRHVVLSLRSPRGARALTCWAASGAPIARWRLDGTAPISLVRFSPALDQRLLELLTGMSDEGRWGMTVSGLPAQGSLLELWTPYTGPLSLRCMDRSDGLAWRPDGIGPRPSEWTEGYPGDHTLVSAPPLLLPELSQRGQ